MTGSFSTWHQAANKGSDISQTFWYQHVCQQRKQYVASKRHLLELQLVLSNENSRRVTARDVLASGIGNWQFHRLLWRNLVAPIIILLPAGQAREKPTYIEATCKGLHRVKCSIIIQEPYAPIRPPYSWSVSSIKRGGDSTLKFMQKEGRQVMLRESTSPQYSGCQSLPQTLLPPPAPDPVCPAPGAPKLLLEG